jgi:DtxR family Mn-dependent transcriptional regulator
MLVGKRQPAQLTPSHEHYLRAIWEVRSRLGYARLVDVAHELGISHATLSVGLVPLERRRLVEHDEHRFLVLTETGERHAREVHHRHAVARAFLRDVLGVDAARAEREACRLEHDLSHETTERLLDLLRLLGDDVALNRALREKLAAYRRSCASGTTCPNCELSCLTTMS